MSVNKGLQLPMLPPRSPSRAEVRAVQGWVLRSTELVEGLGRRSDQKAEGSL